MNRDAAMYTPPACDLTPVLPRRFRSFFLLLVGLLGLQVFAAVQVNMALASVAEGKVVAALWNSAAGAAPMLASLSEADVAMMGLLLVAGAVVLVHDGTARLCSVVSLVLIALGLVLPLVTPWMNDSVRGLAAAMVLVPLFTLPGLLKCGPSATVMRRLTFGVALALLLAFVLLLVEWLVVLVADRLNLGVGEWRPYVAIVVALPVLVRLIMKLCAGALPDAEDLTEEGDVQPLVSSAGLSTTRPAALMLLMVAVLVAFCLPIQDLAMGDTRRWAAAAVLLLFLVCYARSVLLAVREWRFWVALVLLPSGFLLSGTGVTGESLTLGRQVLGVGIPLAGCLLASWLMRGRSPQKVALVFVVLALVMGVCCIGFGAWVQYSLQAGGDAAVAGWPAGVVLSVFGVARALEAPAFCGLVAFALARFPVREGGVACGLMCASGIVVSLLLHLSFQALPMH